jgi:hypothetical protein
VLPLIRSLAPPRNRHSILQWCENNSLGSFVKQSTSFEDETGEACIKVPCNEGLERQAHMEPPCLASLNLQAALALRSGQRAVSQCVFAAVIGGLAHQILALQDKLVPKLTFAKKNQVPYSLQVVAELGSYHDKVPETTRNSCVQRPYQRFKAKQMKNFSALQSLKCSRKLAYFYGAQRSSFTNALFVTLVTIATTGVGDVGTSLEGARGFANEKDLVSEGR